MVEVTSMLFLREYFVCVFCRMVEQKIPERAVTLFIKACEVAEVRP